MPPPPDFWPFAVTLAAGACIGLVCGVALGLRMGHDWARQRIALLENEVEDLNVALDLEHRARRAEGAGDDDAPENRR